MQNSKIFKTITDDVTRVNKSIGLFGLSIQNVQNKLQEIQTIGFKNAIFNASTIDISAIEKYNLLLQRNYNAQKALEIASKGTNSATIALMESANGATISQDQLTAAQKASTLAARTQSAAYKAVSIAANMIAYALIAKGIQLASDAIDHYINRAKYAAEAMEEAQQTINASQNTLKTMSVTLSENKDKFLQLSEGVDKFSNNLHLSEEDYAEYLTISNKLAELFPSLVSGYDDQGNALLAIGANADETNEKLQYLLEVQQAVAQQTLIDNMDDIANGIYYEVENAKNSINDMQSELSTLQEQYKYFNIDLVNSNGLISFKDEDYSKYGTAMENALTSAGIKFEKNVSAGLSNTSIQLVSASPDQLAKAQNFYDTWLEKENEYYHASKNGFKKDIEEKEQSIQNSYAKITASLQSWIKDNYNYQYLSDTSSALADALIPEIKWDELESPPITAFDYQNYVEENIIKPLMEVPSEHKQEIDSMFQQLLSFEDGDLDILQFAQHLQSRLKELGITIDLTPITADEQKSKDKLQSSIESISEGGSGDFYTSTGVKVNANDYNKLQEYTKDFNTEQIELWNSVTLGTENAAIAIQKYEAALNSIFESNESNIPLTISQTLDTLNTQLKPTFDALKTAYQDIFTDDGFTLEDVGISTFTSIKSAIDELNGIDGIQVNYDVFDDFVKVLSDTSSTSEQVQEQFDKLATSIVYSTDCTEMSTDTFDLLCKSLYEMGLTNAPEVLSNIKTAQEELKTSGINLKTVTSEEAKAFINEAQASDIAKEYLRLYMIQKELANNNPLDTSASIQHLKELCTQLGMTYNSLGKTSEMMQAILSLESATNAIAAGVDPGGHYTAQAEAARKKIEELKNSGFEDYSYNFNSNNTVPSTNPSSGNSSDSSSATSTTPSEVTKEFNWIETYLEAFAKKTEKIMNKVSDYLSFKKNISTIKSAVKAVQKEISANEKALQNYQEQMNAVGLDSKYINKIKNGDLNIETITGYETNGSKDANAQLIEKIEKYQELYSTYTSIEDTLEDLRNTEKEWLVKNLEYINEYYQKLSDLKNLAIDKKQDNIDLKEAQGKKVTTGDYNGLISNNESYIKSLRTTYTKTNAEFNNLVKNGTIEKDSNEWFEWTETLADISSEIIQAQINTEEWKDQIEDLNIQKYTDAVDKLKTKNDELNDVISERESLGLEVREKDYSSLIKNNDSQIKQLEKQNALLAEYQSQVQKGSERWKEFQNQIDSNNSSIRQLNQSTTELINNIANIPIEKREDDLETSSDRLALLQKKYDNATSSKERKEILKLMEEEQKKQREINEQAKTTTKSNLSTSQDNLLNYKSKQQSKSEKSSADIKENEKYISSKQKEFNTLSKQESSLNKKISAIDQKIKNTKDKTLLKELKNQKKDYEEQLNEIQARKNEVSSQLTTANKNLEKSKAELKEAEKNVSTLSGFKEGEKIDTEGITDQETLKWVKEYNLALDACEQAEYDAAIADEEWTAQIRENAQKRLDLIKEEYEALIDLNNSYSDATNSFINMRKVQGNPIEDSLYEDLIRNSQKNVDLAYAEWQKHSEQMAQNDYSNNPEGYQKALAENNRLQQAWYESVKTAEEYLDTLMDSRIEALEEEKEKLQKLHELQERRYKLEEAKYNLEKAKQRTNLVYNGTEFVYQADAKSVKDAEKALEDAEYDELIHKIDDWIDAIEAAKENMNLYDADGNLLTNIDEIIEAAKAFGDNLLDGLSKLLESNGYTGGDVSNVPNIIAVRDEELIFTKEQGEKLQQKFSGISPVFADSIHLKPTLPAPSNVNAASHIEINMNGDMQFNEVQNVNDLSKAIVNGQLRNSMKRELGKRKI